MVTYYPIRWSLWLTPIFISLLLSGCASTPQEGDSASNGATNASTYTGGGICDNANDMTRLASPNLTDPLGWESRNGNTTNAPVDLWERVRLGFRLDIPNDWRVRRELSRIIANPESLESGVRRAEPYLHFIVEEAEKRHIPLEIALLPAVESGFRPHAHSPKEAVGLWQFIPSTANTMGLKKNWWYEGRCDITESTRAALDYLRGLADQFDGNWELALAAYNAGPGRVQRAIQFNQNKGLATDFWSLPLPDETRQYVPRLLAIASVLRDSHHYGINVRPLANAPYFKAVTLPNPIAVRQAASLAKVDQATINKLNPGLRRGIAGMGGNYPLLLPVERANQFAESLAKMDPNQLVNIRRYQVKLGDTLPHIARHYGISLAALQGANDLKNQWIQPGRWLIIPGIGIAESNDNANVTPPAAVQKIALQQNANPNKPANIAPHPQSLAVNSNTDANVAKPVPVKNSHVVKPGESLTGIARAYSVDRTQLALWNHLAPDAELRKGQILHLYSFSDLSEARPIIYRVQKGDSLLRIAQRFRVSIEDLRRWNHLYSDVLIPGRRLTLRVATPLTSSL